MLPSKLQSAFHSRLCISALMSNKLMQCTYSSNIHLHIRRFLIYSKVLAQKSQEVEYDPRRNSDYWQTRPIAVLKRSLEIGALRWQDDGWSPFLFGRQAAGCRLSVLLPGRQDDICLRDTLAMLWAMGKQRIKKQGICRQLMNISMNAQCCTYPLSMLSCYRLMRVAFELPHWQFRSQWDKQHLHDHSSVAETPERQREQAGLLLTQCSQPPVVE